MKRAHNSQKFWRLKVNLKFFFICTFSNAWDKFRLWATSFCHLISKRLPVSFCLHKFPQCTHIVSRCLQWRICLYFWMRPLLVMMLYLWVNVPVSAWDRVVCQQSMMRMVYHYCGASHLLFRCTSLLHRNRAIGLSLSQRMTPRGTHFPDKWAAVISIGLFGLKSPTRSSFRAAGLENTRKDTYKCASAWAGTHTPKTCMRNCKCSYIFKHFQTLSQTVSTEASIQYSQCLTRNNHGVIAMISN